MCHHFFDDQFVHTCSRSCNNFVWTSPPPRQSQHRRPTMIAETELKNRQLLFNTHITYIYVRDSDVINTMMYRDIYEHALSRTHNVVSLSHFSILIVCYYIPHQKFQSVPKIQGGCRLSCLRYKNLHDRCPRVKIAYTDTISWSQKLLPVSKVIKPRWWWWRQLV